MARLTAEQLLARLRAWTAATGRFHTSAAVELLADHNFWLRRQDFRRYAVRTSAGYTIISFDAAREAYDADAFLPASTGELLVLNFAIMLGENRFGVGTTLGPNSTVMLAQHLLYAGGVFERITP